MLRTTILQGNSLTVLRALPDQSVHCVVTSPPYFHQRDYKTARWVGGPDADPNLSANCQHIQFEGQIQPVAGDEPVQLAVAQQQQQQSRGKAQREIYELNKPCLLCGAVYHDDQIGLEETLDEYLDNLVAVFSEVWRVLRDDGTLWLNIGDSYSNEGKWAGATGGKHQKGLHGKNGNGPARHRKKRASGCKEKELIGIPWRLALKLQDAGWYLRSEVIWGKVNPMPETVFDRPSRSHEQIFMLTKRPKYFYDFFAVMEATTGNSHSRGRQQNPKMLSAVPGEVKANATFGTPYLVEQRNRRTVWMVANEPYQGDHFATFPSKLIEPCVRAGTSERGCCPQCGAQWVRIVKDGDPVPTGGGASKKMARLIEEQRGEGSTLTSTIATGMVRPKISVGFRPGCRCRDAATGQPYEPIPATVLDPFAGTGTTLKVATSYGRSSIGIELNQEYVEQIRQRLNGVQMRLELAG